jgi:neutral ceramidase
MKNLLPVLCVLQIYATALSAQVPALRAGAAAVDITPTQFPMNMPGGFSANMAEKALRRLQDRRTIE